MLGLAAAAVAVFGLVAAWEPAGGTPGPEQATRSTAAAAALPAAALSAAAAAVPPVPGSAASAPGPAQREQLRRDWQLRLERARQALQGYEQAARYPHESRPASEHPDQQRPFDPVAEEHPLRMPGGSIAQGVRLRTTQERIFLAGNEVSRVTVSLVDAQERPLPLRVQRAVLREVPQPGATVRSVDVPVAMNDAGQSGDVLAGDGVFTAWVQPQLQGFGAVAGLIRLDLNLDHAGQPGYLVFDFIYSPQTAARWLPGVQEAVVGGSLEFVLRAEILLPGRYVVSARVDDAQGRSFAVALFNAELPRGEQAIRLPVFGRLVHDVTPAFPLRLRDVEGFLLKPDTYPDRVMLPRLAGIVHTSRVHALGEFSTAPWNSQERDRYLAELGRDVQRAEGELARLGP